MATYWASELEYLQHRSRAAASALIAWLNAPSQANRQALVTWVARNTTLSFRDAEEYLLAVEKIRAEVERLTAEKAHAVRTCFAATIGWPPDDLERADHRLDALTWHYMNVGGDLGDTLAHFEMWACCAEIEREWDEIVARYEKEARDGRLCMSARRRNSKRR